MVREELIINPTNVITMKKFPWQYTSHPPNTKRQHDATEQKLEQAKQKLEKARQEEETARVAHEKTQKQKKVTELRATVGSLDKQIEEAHTAKVAAKAAKDAIPNDQDKTAHIESHNKADLDHKTLKDEHTAKKAELVAAEKALKGGKRRRRRRTRKTRRKKNQDTIVAIRDIQRNADAHAERDVLVVDKLLNSNNYYTCLE